MDREHFVIIGNGPSGHHAALTLSEKVPGARITLLERGTAGCCSPRLLPDFIAGKVGRDALYLSDVEAYEAAGVKYRPGQRVVGVDLYRRKIFLDHREFLSYTGLIIAVGGRPRIPEFLGVFEDHFLTLKTPDDAAGWIERLREVEAVLIIGGDLTSLALTKALLHLRKTVYFLVDEDALWPLRPTEGTLGELKTCLEARGVVVLPGSVIRGISRMEDGRYRVRFEDRVIEPGLIGAFFGLVPDIRFLAGSGLQIDRGILVDETLNAGFEGVYATGDCAQIYHPELRDYWTSIGHRNAVELGRIAARNLAGEKVAAHVPRENIFKVRGIQVNTSWWSEF